MKMLADTSFLAALYLAEDEHHEEVERIYSQQEGFILLDCVLEELLTVLTYKRGKGLAKRVYEKIKNSETMEIIYLSVSEKEDLYLKFINDSKKIKFQDFALLQFSRILKTNIASFDKDLK